MKIKNIAIMILMTIFLIILGTKVEATTGIVNEESAKLRKEPDSKVILDLLNEGDEVEILEQLDGWYKVKATTELGKVTGYVSEEVVDTAKIPVEKPIETPIETPVETPVETTPVVSTNIETENVEENKQYTLEQEVSVKPLPLMSSRENGKISGTINIIETINDWTKIENDVEIGWIRTNILEKSLAKVQIHEQKEPEQQQEQQPEQQPEEIQQEEPEQKPEEKTQEEPEITEINKTGYVSTDGLRVRKGPSTDTEEITSLSKNDKVEIIGQTGKWYKINLDGEIGYVSAKYISDTKVADTTSRSGNTLKNEQVLEQTETEPKQEETPIVEETPKENTPSTSGTTGASVVEYAKKYLGYKYVSGGASPNTGFDCSGFTLYVYKHFGISLNRTSGAQINNGVAVQKGDLQPGDLVLFNNDSNTKIGHVGIYVGDGNFIHASNPNDGVKITTLTSGYYHKRYVGARRVI